MENKLKVVRNRVAQVFLSEEELTEIRRAAGFRGLGLAGFIRVASLNAARLSNSEALPKSNETI